jgi:CheY-like chemotaxis protein
VSPAATAIRKQAAEVRERLTILLIEDSPADVRLFRHALQESGLSCQLTVLSTGEEVQAFFTSASAAASLALPRLILADCMIPGMEAEEIVAAVRTVPAYQRVPVILFSTLDEREGQRRCVQCGATLFVQKPGGLEAFMTAVSAMVRQWGGGGIGADSTLAGEEELGEKMGVP